MKCLIVITALVSLGLALPLSEFPVSVSQNTNGDYALKYALADSARHEESENGQVHGSYNFVDKEGETHEVSFVSGTQGFVAQSNSIPVQVHPTLEVAAAAADHLHQYAEIAKDLPVLPLEETDPEAAKALKGGFVVLAERPEYEYVNHAYNVEPITVDVDSGADTAEVAAVKALHQLADKHAAKYKLL